MIVLHTLFYHCVYLQQLHDEYKWLRGSHQLIQLWETGGVIVEHVPHAARVSLAL